MYDVPLYRRDAVAERELRYERHPDNPWAVGKYALQAEGSDEGEAET